ncbi:MAG: enoyl-CoA hydratase/isomerase family protein [Agarilytica sp.]
MNTLAQPPLTSKHNNNEELVKLELSDDIATITLNNPGRHNSLTIDLLKQLNERLEKLTRNNAVKILILQAEGRSFSTGGDIKAFYAHADTILDYSQEIVGLLNQSILHMLRLPVPILTKIQGPVTGGSFGFVLASDLVVMDDSAFFAPYYVDVGFAPDGGWSAILPDRIGHNRAKAIQLLNTRIDSATALEWGLVTATCNNSALDSQINTWITTLREKVEQSLVATKQGINTAALIERYQRGLEEERQAFIKLASTPEAKQGMENFLSQFS